MPDEEDQDENCGIITPGIFGAFYPGLTQEDAELIIKAKKKFDGGIIVVLQKIEKQKIPQKE